EEVGFEPTVLSYNGFQDRRLKPLGHSSEDFPGFSTSLCGPEVLRAVSQPASGFWEHGNFSCG
ncbi:MAG: hypothetical protein JXK94_15360, partial [Deltaproteobacteria bacterium]|nr:hypothetical protein [Deltaproteobacteria bacterium]